MTTPTITDELRKATIVYLAAFAHCELLSKRINARNKRFLAENDFVFDAQIWGTLPKKDKEKGNIIRNDDDSYMMDAEHFERYIMLQHADNLAHGYIGIEVGWCPMLTSEQYVRDARRFMINLAMDWTGISFDAALSGGIENVDRLAKIVVSGVVLQNPELTSEIVLGELGIPKPDVPIVLRHELGYDVEIIRQIGRFESNMGDGPSMLYQIKQRLPNGEKEYSFAFSHWLIAPDGGDVEKLCEMVAYKELMELPLKEAIGAAS